MSAAAAVSTVQRILNLDVDHFVGGRWRPGTSTRRLFPLAKKNCNCCLGIAKGADQSHLTGSRFETHLNELPNKPRFLGCGWQAFNLAAFHWLPVWFCTTMRLIFHDYLVWFLWRTAGLFFLRGRHKDLQDPIDWAAAHRACALSCVHPVMLRAGPAQCLVATRNDRMARGLLHADDALTHVRYADWIFGPVKHFLGIAVFASRCRC